MESDDPVVLNLEISAAASEVAQREAEIAERQGTRRGRFAKKFFLAAIGSIPWIGGYLSTLASLSADAADVEVSELQTQWLGEHHEKLGELEGTLTEVDARFASLGDTIKDRIESEDYLGIVRKAFRVWDAADTKEKRRYISNLVTNAGGTRVCSDDIVRMFVEWIERYHESHFAVVREIHQNPGSTRQDVWGALYDIEVSDNSPEADLFKLLFRDLSTGGIIRQERDVNQLGQFVRKRPAKAPKGYGARTMKSAFR